MIPNFIKKPAYAILEKTSGNKGIPVTINDTVVRFPPRYFRCFPKNYEAENFKFLKDNVKPGATVLDIGAHIGLYAVFFERQGASKIFSFEPTPTTADVLRATVKMNGCKNVTVLQMAVADKEGKATFFADNNEISTGNSLLDLADMIPGRNGAYEVEVTSIDTFRAQKKLKIDVLKIDAEGAELAVLEGAANTFLQDRPVGIIGLHPFAYKNPIEMLSSIWDKLDEYNVYLSIDGIKMNREIFVNKTDRVFDVEFLQKS